MKFCIALLAFGAILAFSNGQYGPETNCKDIGPCNPPCKVDVTGPCPVCSCVKCDFSDCNPPCKHYKRGDECICDCDQ
ncbi:uncharacterized protein TNCT_667461 [Trichonephila clavata]|uniref:Uncharacterized protein n=1 Tax=Trichonephila clavata TaxID=2740835 RepID=A0A8X6GNW4_TRICU|nr:uncharacterized protein TNCT_667461 [Trichonephila clavata]